jgi:hypothetical protein
MEKAVGAGNQGLTKLTSCGHIGKQYCTCAVGIGVIARITTQPRGHGHSCSPSADDYPSSPGGCDDVPDWRGASNSTRRK